MRGKKNLGFNMTIKNVEMDDSVRYIEPVNLYGCKLEKDVFIGPFVEIQKDVLIMENTRIQSHSFVCSNVKIGKDCFIGHGVVFTNDRFKDGVVNFKPPFEETIIGNNVLIGSNSTILPVKITDDVVIGAGSVVVNDIEESGTYVGNPLRRIEK